MTENIRQAGNNGRGLHGQLFIWKAICWFRQNLTYFPYKKENRRKKNMSKRKKRNCSFPSHRRRRREDIKKMSGGTVVQDQFRDRYR